MKRPLFIGLITLLLVSATVLLWRVYHAENASPDIVAANWNHHLLNGDAEELYKLAYPVEKNGYRLNSQQLRRLSVEFFQPKVQGAKYIPVSAQAKSIYGEWKEKPIGIAQGFVLLRNGVRLDQGSTAIPAGEAVSIRFADALLDAWEVEAIGGGHVSTGPNQAVRSWLWGIRRDRALLESIGLRGTFENPAESEKFNTWDDLIAKAKRWIAQAERKIDIN